MSEAAARRMGSEEVAFSSSLQKTENGTGHVDLEHGDATLFRDESSTTAALLDESNGGKYEQENHDEHEGDHHSGVQHRRSGLLLTTLLASATVIFAAAFAVVLGLYVQETIQVERLTEQVAELRSGGGPSGADGGPTCGGPTGGGSSGPGSTGPNNGGGTGPNNGGGTGPNSGAGTGPNNGGGTGPNNGSGTGPNNGGGTGPNNGGGTGPNNGGGGGPPSGRDPNRDPVPVRTNQLPLDVPSEMVEVFRATDAAAAGKRVAVCMVGGVRALTLPNVYKSIGDNLLGNLKDTGVGVDLFFLGSLTPRGHNGGAASADTISQPDDPRLVAGLDYLESKVSTFAKKRIVPDSTCGAVADVMADQGRGVRSSAPGEAPRYDGPPVLPTSLCTDRQFYKSAWFLQMMWVDACFADVEKHAEAHNLTYDLVVRARPDTGFFEPLDWNAAAASPEFSVARNFPTLPARPPTSTNRVWDWFFTAPFHYIPKFRAGTVGWYVKYDSAANEFRDNLNGKHGLPDFGAFANYSFTTVVRRPFPVTIVRTASQAQCNFFEGYKKEGFEQVGSRLFGDCEQKQRDAYWGL